MYILAIETSCDETAVALYQGDRLTGIGSIVSEEIASQIETHARFGGVVPEVASREHLQALPSIVERIMASAGIRWTELDAIAVTAGPGLMGALLVGVSYARALGIANGIPVWPIHHMEGHLLAPGVEGNLPDFPFITLLVSGGHTLLVRVDGIGDYRVIGQTLDDAAGECFDKSARVLGLPYPGGPEISRLAMGGDGAKYKLPRPMLNQPHLNFSFSGLKTAVLYAVRKIDSVDSDVKRDMAASIEAAIGDVLVKKSMRACEQEAVLSLVIAGGVAANDYLRRFLLAQAQVKGIGVTLPAMKHCTDNAAMIAYAAFRRLIAGAECDKAWDISPRWSLESLKLRG